jgi:hypothetical protein
MATRVIKLREEVTFGHCENGSVRKSDFAIVRTIKNNLKAPLGAGSECRGSERCTSLRDLCLIIESLSIFDDSRAAGPGLGNRYEALAI